MAIHPHPLEKVFSAATLVVEDRVIAMYDGTMGGNMVAVPAISCCSTERNIVAPGVTTPGIRVDAPIILLDMYPTLLELAGLQQEADNDSEGFRDNAHGSIREALAAPGDDMASRQPRFPH
ncbi:MAG: hypothetical protein OXN89_26530 [Bryobacterales bacterium]|nr:hypothetical protein [Bryobacterales bacterium]